MYDEDIAGARNNSTNHGQSSLMDHQNNLVSDIRNNVMVADGGSSLA